VRAPGWLTARPVAHRGLHDAARGIIENMPGAAQAAVDGNFGIECDVQLTADGEAMVHHDDALGRLTEGSGALLGNFDATERLMQQYLPPERVSTIMEEIRGPAGRNMWEKLSNVQEQVLANYLKNEYPQTVAVVLSKIRTEHAARVLAILPEETALDVVTRMLKMEAVQKDVIERVENTLRTEFMSNLSQTRRRDAHEVMAEIFNNFDRSVGQGLVVRFPVDPATPNLPGRINFIVQTNQNIQKLRVEGLDINLNLRFPKLDWGQFRAALQGTYLIKWEQADTDTGQLVNLAGQSTGGIATVQGSVGFPGALPRWKHTASVYYDYGPWAATLTQLYQDSYQDDTTAGITRNVGSYTVWDISGAYTGFKNVTLSAGIKNLIDTNPPTSVQQQAFQVGYDPTYADPRGRLYWASVKYSFK